MLLKYRENLIDSDRRDMERILHSSGFFHAEEIDTALELIDETRKRGAKSGYYFILASNDQHVVGYSCYGPIPCTVNRWDLYWLAVSDSFRGKGLGRTLLSMTEEKIRRMGGKRIYIETSSRDLYLPTRSFYEKLGYNLETVQKDYYNDNDDKCLYVKEIQKSDPELSTPVIAP